MPKTSVDRKSPRFLTATEASRPLPHIPQVRSSGHSNHRPERAPKARPVKRWIDESVVWTDEERAEAEASAEKAPAFIHIGQWPNAKVDLI